MTEVSTHRTTAVPLEITCPNWCSRSAAEHAADLWNYEGRCIHLSRDVEIPDTAGWTAYGEPVRFHESHSVYVSSIANPSGRETESPILYFHGHEVSTSQALAVADEIRRRVQLYRSTGGVT
jgi:hypothetical protein